MAGEGNQGREDSALNIPDMVFMICKCDCGDGMLIGEKSTQNASFSYSKGETRV